MARIICEGQGLPRNSDLKVKLGEMTRVQEPRVDEVSVQKLRENHKTSQKFTSQLHEMQEQMSLSGSGDLRDVESSYCHTATYHLVTNPVPVWKKDDSGSFALFTEQGSSASQMTAAKIMYIISRLPGCDGQAADAVSAYTQVKMEDAHKLLKIPKSESRHLDSSTTTQMAQIMVQYGRPCYSS